VQPVRVKIYGLFTFTRTGYLREAVVEALMLVVVVAVWILGWPDYRKMLIVQEPLLQATKNLIALMDAVPWILIAAVLAKGFELVIVLRAFARKAREASQAAPPPPTPPVSAGSG
jgi:hypothetical protein